MAAPQFVRSLIRLGLLDEYHLRGLPVAVGGGTQLFTAPPALALRLITSTGFPSSILKLRTHQPTATTWAICGLAPTAATPGNQTRHPQVSDLYTP
jgi:hypothetical protein